MRNYSAYGATGSRHRSPGPRWRGCSPIPVRLRHRDARTPAITAPVSRRHGNGLPNSRKRLIRLVFLGGSSPAAFLPALDFSCQPHSARSATAASRKHPARPSPPCSAHPHPTTGEIDSTCGKRWPGCACPQGRQTRVMPTPGSATQMTARKRAAVGSPTFDRRRGIRRRRNACDPFPKVSDRDPADAR